MKLAPYLKYKDSGLPWLGEIPVGWEVHRNGRLFSQRNETGFPDLPVLEVSLKTGVRVRDFESSKRKQVMADFGKYKRAARGDIAYNMMRMWQGAVGVAPVDGLISPAYVVARPRSGTDSRYFSLLFRTTAYMNEVNMFSHGIVSDRNRLYWDEFKQMPSVVPPPDEQRQIACFLDAIGNKVRQFIRNKRRLIALLREQKQNLITQAIRQGINPDVKHKSSGAEWLGDIPEHWAVMKLKRLAKMRSGDSITALSIDDTSEFPVFGGNGLRGYTSAYTHDGSFVLVGRQGALCGNVHWVSGRFWASEHAVVTTLKPGNNIEWFTELLRVMNLNQYSESAAQPGISVEEVQNLYIPVPPAEEQSIIADFLRGESQAIDLVIERTEREIELMREYRARLISDVATGKVDVRDVPVEMVSEDDLLEIEEDAEELDDTPQDELLEVVE